MKHRQGAVFCHITKVAAVIERARCDQQVNGVLRDIAKESGLHNSEQITAHSLRCVLATEPARLGASMPAIQRHRRWRSTKAFVEYIEAGRQFENSALHVLFAEGG